MKPALIVVASAVLLAGCTLQPTAVSTGSSAPTGIASGPTLYFVDAAGQLTADERDVGRLGSVSDALALLLTGPGASELHTEIAAVDIVRVEVTNSEGLVEIRLPLAENEVTQLGIDQIVCTAIASEVQRGGSIQTRVRLVFTIAEAGADVERTCPLNR